VQKALRLPLLAAFLGMLSASADGRPIPGLDLAALISRADVIVTGELVSLTQSGTSMVAMPEGARTAKVMLADISVDQVLKGYLGTPRATVRYVWPEEWNGYGGLPQHRYRLVFLRRSSGTTYELVSPYYPSLAAVPGSTVQGSSDVDRVASSLGAVVMSEGASPADQIEAIGALAMLTSPEIVSPLRYALNRTDVSVRLSAAAALLQHNDMAALEPAEVAIRSSGLEIPSYLRHNLLYAISEGVRDERAIPTLSRLFSLRDDETRRAVVTALRHTGSRVAIGTFLVALDDPDFAVRYYAVVALAEITGQTEWRPLMEDFKANEQHYLAHWREWGKISRLGARGGALSEGAGARAKEFHFWAFQRADLPGAR
jgi:hypothetical protein